MGWFKVDDNLAFHQKTLAAGNAAMGLWVRAGSWSRATGSDGFIPDTIARQAGKREQTQAIIDVGFWDRLPTGYAFHEWDERQPSAADEKAAAEAAGRSGTLGNHKRWHLAKKVRNPDCVYCTEEGK